MTGPAHILVDRLGGEAKGPLEAMVPGPGHSPADRSLHISFRSSQPDDFIAHSFAGDRFDQCRDLVRDAMGWGRSLPSRQMPDRRTRCPALTSDDREAKRRAARAIWKASLPAKDTVVEAYLARRGITVPIPPTIRYAPALWHPETRRMHPAMVAAISGPGRNLLAVHRTYLAEDGSGKLDVREPKLALGHMDRGAVRLAPAGPVLGIAEGIEDALSAMQIDRVPVWAALGAVRLPRIEIPACVEELRVYADANATGREYATKAQEEFKGEFTTSLSLPPPGHSDWNAYLAASGGRNG